MINRNIYFSTIQWFAFLLANSIALPIVIGNVFHLETTEILDLMQRIFFIVGLSSFIQATLGHRFPLADGPAGSWVSIFVIYAGMIQDQGMTIQDLLQILSGGIMIAGFILLLLGVTKWVQKLLFLFTPIVTGTFLFILAVQLGIVFFRGMMAKSSDTGQIDLVGFLLSLLVFIIIVFLITKGKGWIKSYSILIGIVFGWVLFLCLGKVHSSAFNNFEIMKLPKPFAWGFPQINGGIILTVVLFSFLLISNTVAAISAGGEVISTEKKLWKEKLNRATLVGGISHLLSAVFSTIAVVPIPATAGFVKITKQYNIKPFLLACVLLMLVSVFPGIVGFMASLPLPVASAALLATLIDMFRIALRSLNRQTINLRNRVIIGISIFCGIICIIFIPTNMFNSIPNSLQVIVRNGLLMATFLAMILETVWKEKKSKRNSLS